MKRVICLVMAFIITTLLFSHAEVLIDYSKLSDEELYSLIEKAYDEMEQRMLQGTIRLNIGSYIAGRYLVPGIYRIEYVDAVDKKHVNSFGAALGSFKIFKDAQTASASEYNYIISSNIVIDTSRIITLESGNVLDLKYGYYDLTFIGSL